ncbi:hypothetical protein K3888_14465 [Dietzia aurantiaca]|uniref:hypothetical protein n=1 Tax=Dietzia aurantiaca TaxID=983873 RepID=UPI001E64C92D|nr:hypothetical protein [Dietzia aurantiaca]MCD2263902.1 hypothetical protein [Dietzia aurantiaca]
MSKFQQLRAKAIAFRGAIAICGAVVVAVSMFQAADTLAAPNDVRQAKVGIATQNYFPTPLTSSVRCETNAPWYDSVAGRRADIVWNSVPNVTGYILELVAWRSGDPDGVVRQSYPVPSTTTRVNGIRDSGREVLYARVRTVNGIAVSSGYATPTQRISFKDYATGRTECEQTGHPTLLNQPWENQYDWNPDGIPFAVRSDELTSLEEAALDAVPNGSEAATSSPSSTPISTLRSSPVSSESTTSPTGNGTKLATEKTTGPASSAPAKSNSPAVTLSSTAPTSTSAGAKAPVRAQVGDSPIAVGASQVWLEAVDGRTQLIVTRKGSEVCTAEVDGASWIESSDGGLAVTVSGRTVPVNLETCELT